MLKYGNSIITTTTDDFGRTDSVTSSGYTLSYTYKDGSASNSTTNLVDTMTYELDEDNIAQYTYTYDANGNITQVKEGNTIIASYLYDSLNQLLSVNYRSRNLYFTYYYDNSGNITSQSIQNLHPTYGYPIGSPETITYTYGDTDWKDKLTSYDGDTISYDEIGNPMSYRDGMIMQWQNGRELASITKPNGTDTETYSFEYNLSGLRIKKTKKHNDTVVDVIDYYYDDSNNLIGLKKGDTTVLYYHDSDGELVSMSVEYSGNNTDATYFFVKNLQSDITKIVDDSGDEVATYAYDAWGQILAENEDSEVEGLNPFRYRGYVYDPETELYYLQSRYYDPLTSRFLNADDPEYTDTNSGSPLSTNMFAYCENDPVSGYDPSGNWDKGDHRDLNSQLGFSKVTYQASYLADKYFYSGNGYSSPFHSRDGKHSPNSLKIAKKIYNMAITLSKEYNKGFKSMVKFCYSNEDVNNARKLPIKYYAYLKKSNWTYNTNIDRARKLLKYLNGNQNNDLANMGYDIIQNRKNQADALIGLSLHTIQDYFAHLITVTAKGSKDKYNGRKKVIYKYGTMTSVNNIILKNHTLLMEDNKKVLPWRWNATKSITKTIYNLYKQNKRIKSMYSIDIPEIYTCNLLNHDGKSGRGYANRYWYLIAHRVAVQINC